MKKKIGFIGLGAMGSPMASNLSKAGFNVTVYDIRKERINPLVLSGANSASTPKEVASLTDVIITSLPSSPDVKKVVLGEKGIIEGAHEGHILIDMSTIDPLTTQEVAKALAQKGVRMIDAPVAGGVKAAASGTLTIFMGGQEEIVEECKEVLEVLGSNIYHVGNIGAGETVKIVNNLILAGNVCVLSEGLVLGVKAGVKPEILVEALRKGSADSFALGHHIKNFVLKGKFRKGIFSVDYMLKDLRLVLETGKRLRVPLYMTSLATQLYEGARAKGKSQNYHPVVITQLEDLTGVQVRSKEARGK